MDDLQQHLVDRAFATTYEALESNRVGAAGASLLRVVAAIVRGFGGASAGVARRLAANAESPGDATVIGAGTRCSIDLAAFANSAALTDGVAGFERLLPALFAAAEHSKRGCQDLLTAIALTDELQARLSAVMNDEAAFSPINASSIATAVAVGKLLGLSRGQLAECASLAATTNVVLDGEAWNAAPQAARAATFAALTAQSGMEGPRKPFEGKTGWLDHVAIGRAEQLAELPLVSSDLEAARRRFVEDVTTIIGAEQTVAIVDAIRDGAGDLFPLLAAIRLA